VFFYRGIVLRTGYRFGMDSGLACSDFRIMRRYTNSYANTDSYPNTYSDTDTNAYTNTNTKYRVADAYVDRLLA
jgi:hypothetical protein